MVPSRHHHSQENQPAFPYTSTTIHFPSSSPPTHHLYSIPLHCLLGDFLGIRFRDLALGCDLSACAPGASKPPAPSLPLSDTEILQTVDYTRPIPTPRSSSQSSHLESPIVLPRSYRGTYCRMSIVPCLPALFPNIERLAPCACCDIPCSGAPGLLPLSLGFPLQATVRIYSPESFHLETSHLYMLALTPDCSSFLLLGRSKHDPPLRGFSERPSPFAAPRYAWLECGAWLHWNREY